MISPPRPDSPRFPASGSDTVALIVNPRSGSAQNATDLQDMFHAHGLAVRLFRGPNPVDSANAAIHEGARTLIAAGGDGTVNAVASVAVKSDATLGVLPVGTLNHFAKALQMPLDLDAAIDVIAQGKTVLVDVGEVNGRVFVNNSSLGLYPSIVILRKNQQQLGWGKWIALGRAVLLSLRWMPLLHIRLTADDRVIQSRTPLVFIGNNEYSIDGPAIGDRKTITDGKLFVCVTDAASPFGLIATALYAFFGRSRESDNLHSFLTTEATIERRRRRERVALDGEVAVMSTPLHYRIRPASLRVLVP